MRDKYKRKLEPARFSLDKIEFRNHRILDTSKIMNKTFETTYERPKEEDDLPSSNRNMLVNNYEPRNVINASGKNEAQFASNKKKSTDGAILIPYFNKDILNFKLSNEYNTTPAQDYQ